MNTTENPADHGPVPTIHVEQGLRGSKDGKGIGDLADDGTVESWVQEYLRSDSPPDHATAFRYGVRAEGRHAGQSFIEAEASIRSEWSSERGHGPWEGIRDAVWAGFDRARDRRM
jgi:hypothetical protein